MSERRPYHRVQPRNWWAQKPYRAYTLRELTGVAVSLYGAVLLAGLVSLWRGPDAFEAYRQWATGNAALLLHLVLLAVMLWHVVTWFQILPKTMPKLIVGGRLIAPSTMTAVAMALAVACSIGLVVVVLIIGALS